MPDPSAATANGHPAIDAGGHPADPSKRDMLELLAGSGAAIMAGSIAWALIDSMNPAKDVLALASIDVDLTPVAVGQGITVMWQGKPVFIRRRSPKEIADARAVKPGELPDPQTDKARTKDGREQWIVLVGICTHLGCIPLGNKTTDMRGDWGGWFCPCHGSQYDTSGRIRKGPAPRNLDVPPYAFTSDTAVRIG